MATIFLHVCGNNVVLECQLFNVISRLKQALSALQETPGSFSVSGTSRTVGGVVPMSLSRCKGEIIATCVYVSHLLEPFEEGHTLVVRFFGQFLEMS